MSQGFQLFIAVAFIFIVTTVLRTAAQDIDDSEVFPSQRKARVSNMIDAKHSVSKGGHKIVLTFEDDLEPETFTIWADQTLFDKVVTGDLFIFHYRPDGTVIKYYGPVKEDE